MNVDVDVDVDAQLMFDALRNGRDAPNTPGLGRRLEMGLCSSAARRQGAYRTWMRLG